MIVVTVNNSSCKIEGLSFEVEHVLRGELRFINQDISYSLTKNNRAIEEITDTINDKRFKIDSQQLNDLNKRIRALKYKNAALAKDLHTPLYVNGEFPTGLLPRVLKILDYYRLQFTICDLRIEPKKCSVKYVLKNSFPQLRYYQKAANRIATERGRGIIVSPTGTGKSLVIAKMIWELGVKTLVITPGKAITDNMMDTLTHHFGKGQVTKLTTKSKKISNINVCNIQALIKIDPNVLKGIDAVFIDEFHHSAAETYQEINLNHLKHCYFRLGFTATCFRNDGSDLALEAVLSEILYEYTIKQAILDGFLIKPKFLLQDNESPVNDSYGTEVNDGIVNNHDRNDWIVEIAQYHKNNSVIILIDQVEHGEMLQKLIPNSALLHGEEKDSIRQRVLADFRKGKIAHLIGTAVIGEGVDLPIADTLILGGGGKAKSTLMQKIGRILRPFPTKKEALVYMFAERGSRYLSDHSLQCQEIFKEYEV